MLEKTDRIDASIIARFAQVWRLPPWTPDADNLCHLPALVQRRRQLPALRVGDQSVAPG